MAKEFEFFRENKFLDNLERVAAEWMEECVSEFYDVDDIGDLSADQIERLIEYTNQDDCSYYVSLGIRNVIDQWEWAKENED